MILPQQRDEAKAQPLGVKPANIMNYSDAPYFVDYLQDILVEQFGDLALGRSKYKVYTPLDMDLQQAAFESVRDEMVKLDEHFAKGKRGIPPGTVQASLIAVDPEKRRSARHGGRQELRRQPVQSHHAVEKAARKHLQTLRVCRGTGDSPGQRNAADSRVAGVG